MESQTRNRHPQEVGTHQGEEEDHQEKSVLTKVKDRAKKMRNKFTKHGRGHEDDHHDPDGEDEEEEEDLEVHEAPTVGSRATGKGDILKAPMAKSGDTKAAAMGDHDSKVQHLEKTGKGDILKAPMAKSGDTKAAAMGDHDSKVQHLEKTDPMKDCVPKHDEVLEPKQNYHASMIESLVGHDQIPSQKPKVALGKTSATGEAPHAPQNPPLPSLGEYKSRGTDQSQTSLSGNEGHLDQSKVHTPVSSLGGDYQKTNVADPRQTSVSGKEGRSGQTGVRRGVDDRTPISSRGDSQKTNVTDPSHTFATGKEGHFGQSEVNLDRPRGLQENTQAFTPPNDQTKVTDPAHAGGEEIGITPIVRSFDKMNIRAGDAKPSNQGSSYTEKVSSAASAIAGKATSAKNAVASTLGYDGGNIDQHEDVKPHAYSPENDSTKSGKNQNLGTGSHDQFSPEHPPNQGGGYTEKVPSATPSIADRAISAKNAAASKVGYGGGNNDQHEFVKPQASGYQTTGTGQNLSTPENPSNQGTYTGKISSATYAIAGTAISAKNVVASKLGYGGDTDQQQQGDHAAVRPGAAAPEQQGKGITAAVTEKPTPVYDKVAGAGSTLMSKLPVSTGTAGKEEVYQGTAATRGEHDKAGKDKGVSEKLKSGEEDRALSEAISKTLHKPKAEQPQSGARPVGKMTESAAVAQRLGPDYGPEDDQKSSYGKDVADTLKGGSAVGAGLSAKNAVDSKVGYGGGNNDQHEFGKPQASGYQTGTGQNLSTPENPSNQGSYTGKISSTAISAKNVVASKLGYGGDTDQQQQGDHTAVRPGAAAPEQRGKGITTAVTEKVAGAGITPMSKLPGSTGTAGKEEVRQGTATTRGEHDKAGKDKGGSVKGYFSEKLKPGEEDMALSEAISETQHKPKAEQPQSGARPVGKVTEAAEVTQRLGPDYGPEDVQQSSYGKVVADTLKGAVGSLFGKADQTTASPKSHGSSTGTEGL